MESIRRASRFVLPPTDEIDLDKFIIGAWCLVIAIILFIVEIVEGFAWYSTTIAIVLTLVGLWGISRRKQIV